MSPPYAGIEPAGCESRREGAMGQGLNSPKFRRELRLRVPAEAYEKVLERIEANEFLDFAEFYREERKTKPTLTREEAAIQS